jgi:hypothetical protein
MTAKDIHYKNTYWYEDEKTYKLVELEGDKRWYKNGKLHRDDGPAIEWANGDKSWYKNGKLYMREGFGTKHWYKNGKLHKDDGPAAEYSNGDKYWHKNGEYHRDNGPAIECANGDKYWYKNGKWHRDNGPAIECANGDKEYWYNDQKFNCKTTEEFLKQIEYQEFQSRLCKLSKDEFSIMKTLLTRLEKGRETYGEWNVNDNRNYSKEALEEIIDALHYCAALIVKLPKI